MRKGTDALGPKFDRLSEIVTEMINNYGQIKQAIRECEETLCFCHGLHIFSTVTVKASMKLSSK
jgi:hypothetical protein